MLEKTRVSLAVILLAASLPLASAEEKPLEIADPVAKRLVEEARNARKEHDTARAIIKLDEACEKAPRDPAVLFERAQLFEEMAKFDTKDKLLAKRAADAYQRIFELGKEKAGSLYDLAAKKLAEGF